MHRPFVLLGVMISLCVQPVAFAKGHDIRKEAASLRGRWNTLFHEQIRECDSVRVTYHWYLAKGQFIHVVRDSKAIKALVDAIEVVEDHNGASVGCFGPYRYEFMRGKDVVADVSEACSALFWRDGPWVGTPSMTARGQKALRAWTDRYIPTR